MSPFQGGGGDMEGASSRAKTSSSNPNSSSGQKRVTQADVERFAKALTEFQVPKEVKSLLFFFCNPKIVFFQGLSFLIANYYMTRRYS